MSPAPASPAVASTDVARGESRVALRRRLLAARTDYAATPAFAEAQARVGAALCDALASIEPVCLGLYTPLRFEFNVHAAIVADRRLAKTALALPYARREPRSLDYRHWDGAPDGAVDECGIASSAGAVVIPDVAVVPCVGYTASAHRLGYGGGYYDRWLALHPHVVAIGVAWSGSEIDAASFVAEAHDVPLGFVVTELGVR